ncbi:MAG: hypothetical protein ACF8SC_12195 [Phycisphaerales bacterium JB037]
MKALTVFVSMFVCLVGLVGCGGSENGGGGGKMLGDASLVGKWNAEDGSWISVSDSPAGDFGNWKTHSNADDDRPNEMGNFSITKKGVITSAGDDEYRYTISGDTLEITTPSGEKVTYTKE